jgi:hypothetical protein
VTADVSANDRVLTEVAHLDGLNVDVGEDREQVMPPLADAIVTVA